MAWPVVNDRGNLASCWIPLYICVYIYNVYIQMYMSIYI